MFRLPKFHRKDVAREAAHRLYVDLVAQARRPAFYSELGVPDTLDGRFDMIALHAFLVMRRLKQAGEPGKALAQELFDVMFADLDQSLRELGVGDLGVGKRVKVMAKAFYGRIAAYDAALEGSDEMLAKALSRNLFGTGQPTDAQLRTVAAYLRRVSADLSIQPDASLLAGQAHFGPPPA